MLWIVITLEKSWLIGLILSLQKHKSYGFKSLFVNTFSRRHKVSITKQSSLDWNKFKFTWRKEKRLAATGFWSKLFKLIWPRFI